MLPRQARKPSTLCFIRPARLFCTCPVVVWISFLSSARQIALTYVPQCTYHRGCVLSPSLLLWQNIYVILIFSCWLPKFLALVAISLGAYEMKDWSGRIWTRSAYKISRIKTQAFHTLPRRWLAEVTCLSSASLEKLLSRCSQNAPIVKASGVPFPLECDDKVHVGKRGHLAKEFLQWMTISAYMRYGLRKFFSNVFKVSTKIITPLPSLFSLPLPHFLPCATP